MLLAKKKGRWRLVDKEEPKTWDVIFSKQQISNTVCKY